VTPCNLAGRHQRFARKCCVHLQDRRVRLTVRDLRKLYCTTYQMEGARSQLSTKFCADISQSKEKKKLLFSGTPITKCYRNPFCNFRIKPNIMRAVINILRITDPSWVGTESALAGRKVNYTHTHFTVHPHFLPLQPPFMWSVPL